MNGSSPVRTAAARTLACAIAFSTALSSCFGGRGERTLIVSSERSTYSPVVSLSVKVRISDSVRIRVLRAMLLAPGDAYPGMGAVTGNLFMQALVVRTSSVAGPAGNTKIDNGVGKPWVEVAMSNVIEVVDSLHMGVPRNVTDLYFALPLKADLELSKTWVVFRVTGSAHSGAVHMADGTTYPERTDRNGVRVFACSSQNLNGVVDKMRTEQLHAAYSEWC